jgi:hypothetical protein
MDQVTVTFHCGQDGRPFRAVLQRERPSDRYRVLKILEGAAFVAAAPESSPSRASPTLPRLASDETDWSAWFCPFCEHGKHAFGTFVNCGGCGWLVCGGRIYRSGDGIETYECPNKTCPSGGGRISGTIEAYDASPSVPQGPTGPALPPGSTHTRLSGGEGPKLPPGSSR